MKRILFLLLCLASTFVHAEAGSSVPATAWGLPQLMQSLAQAQSSQGSFVERKHLAVLDVPLTSSGTMLFRAPDHLEKHTLAPREENLVLNQGVLTIDDKARNVKHTLVLQQYPAVWALVESIRSTLAGDQAMLERFYKVELKGNAAQWHMQLLPLEKRMRTMVSEIVIAGQGNRIHSIEMREANGDHSTMTLIEDMP
jgi:outer membrane lipoprotein-sorting protein